MGTGYSDSEMFLPKPRTAADGAREWAAKAAADKEAARKAGGASKGTPPAKHSGKPSGAAMSRAAAQVSTSLPGTAWPPAPPPEKPPPPKPAATSRLEQYAGSIPGFGQLPTQPPPVANPAAAAPAAAAGNGGALFDKDSSRGRAAAMKGSANMSALFGTPQHHPPPPQPKRPKAEQPTSTAAQQAGTGLAYLFGPPTPMAAPAAASPRQTTPRGVSGVGGLGRGGGGASKSVREAWGAPQLTPRAAASAAKYHEKYSGNEVANLIYGGGLSGQRRPSPSRMASPGYGDYIGLVDSPRTLNRKGGAPSEPVTTAEAQISYVLGGAPEDRNNEHTVRHRRSKAIVRVAFEGLGPEMNTPRLMEKLQGLPFDQGVHVGRGTVKVAYDPLRGRASGHAEAEFRSVPDSTDLQRTLARAKSDGSLRMRTAHLTYDDTRKVLRRFGEPNDGTYAGKDLSLENSGVPDDRFTSVSRMSYTGGRFVSDASVPPSVLAAQASEAKQHFLRTGDARRSQGRMADRRV